MCYEKNLHSNLGPTSTVDAQVQNYKVINIVGNRSYEPRRYKQDNGSQNDIF
jgi:hypothetical protein